MLTRVGFLGRTLLHHWRGHLALGLGAAVACAILTGALLVGDSMRASLRGLARERLGHFDLVLESRRLFRAELAGDVAASSSFPPEARPPVAVLALDASAARVGTDGSTGARVGRIRALGVSGDFFRVGFEDAPGVESSWLPGEISRGTVTVNRTLARELVIEVGDALLLAVRMASAAPLESFLGRRSDQVRTLRLQVGAIIPDRGPGLHSLRGDQRAPRLAYVALGELQRATGFDGLASVLLAVLAEGSGGETARSVSRALADGALREALEPGDIGLQIRTVAEHGVLSVQSTRMILAADVVEAVQAMAKTHAFGVQPVLTHLAERIALEGDADRFVPYTTVAALNIEAAPPLGPLSLLSGEPAPVLGPGEIVVNEWAAGELGIDPDESGQERVVMTYYVAGADESVTTARATFRVRGVIALRGVAADRTLTPEFPGITDASVTSMARWDPPFEMDFDLIDDRDEKYWELYRATPRAFVSAADGRRFFATRYGPATSIRIAPPAGMSLEDADRTLRDALLQESNLPSRLGIAWRDARRDGLGATAGGTGGEFDMLFVSLSFFLIVAAAVLVALLFGLQLDRRVREAGILLAQGFTVREVRRLFLAEATIVVGLGGVLGVGLAVAYAAFLLEGLRTWWWAAVRIPLLVLAIDPASVLIGYLSTGVVVLVAIVLAGRGLRRIPVRDLLAGVPLSGGVPGSVGREERRPATSRSLRLGVVSGILALVIAVVAFAGVDVPMVAAFFGSGTLALVSGLALFWSWLRGAPRQSGNMAPNLFGLGARNARQGAGRSLLTVALVAAATFVIIAVGASRHDPREDRPARDSGNGGFALAASSEIPLPYRLGTAVGQDELGLADLAFDRGDGKRKPVDWTGMRSFRFRVRPGDNASCINLYAPGEPRILGVPRDFVERGGFLFQGRLDGDDSGNDNAWSLLGHHFDDGAVPVIADANSATWILKKGLGDDITVRSDRGESVTLRLVATLSRSIFQGELLMSEKRFLEHFPSIEGRRFFLVELPDDASGERTAEIEHGLELGLEDFGLDAVRTNVLIASFLAVESTYISIFQMLGGLGLLLGTFGLGIVLLRGIIERRGELALLRAIGFRRSALASMVIAEDVLLLVAGIGIGTGAALLGLLLRVEDPGMTVPWSGLAALLTLVFVSGLASAAAAVASAVRAPLLPALRAD